MLTLIVFVTSVIVVSTTAILQHPESQIVVPGQIVSLNCTVKGESMGWIVNGEHPTVERNKLLASGIQFLRGERVNGVWKSTIVIPTTIAFNRTRIKCIAENASYTLESLEAVMTIAGIQS